MVARKIPTNEFFDKIYVITIESNQDRQAVIRDKLKNFKYEIFSGVNGKLMSAEERSEQYDATLARINCGRDLSPGEIGCALSHRAIYLDMIKNNYKSVLILEDDVFFDPTKTNELLSTLRALPPDWDLLYLGYNRNNGKSGPFKSFFINYLNPVLRAFGFKKYEKNQFWGTHYCQYNKSLNFGGSYDLAHAYALKRNLAEKLVNKQTPVSDTADGVLIKLSTTGAIKVYTSIEQIFVQSDAFESSIWSEGKRKHLSQIV